ncbi:hypothetical protein OMAG_000644 [Candidatus Omnitrophus magneticus]|uniref:Uncharacterized protein n=1 Tax=Candidatus Omnitrophus magneticus TaxID=1609969 RepID=A0A0F0CQD4_9BACT|nr:hypothetical protein OMAG_000644 [Candidatus Omnitrophus magneticus]
MSFICILSPSDSFSPSAFIASLFQENSYALASVIIVSVSPSL